MRTRIPHDDIAKSILADNRARRAILQRQRTATPK
jgi:hypothetical protein